MCDSTCFPVSWFGLEMHCAVEVPVKEVEVLSRFPSPVERAEQLSTLSFRMHTGGPGLFLERKGSDLNADDSCRTLDNLTTPELGR